MYLFSDAGIITNQTLNKRNLNSTFSELRVDAGIGFIYSFKNFKPLEKVKPLVIRLDLPLFLNRPPATDEFVQMRWIVGINKLF